MSKSAARWAIREDGDGLYTVFLDNGSDDPVEYGGMDRLEAVSFMREMAVEMMRMFVPKTR